MTGPHPEPEDSGTRPISVAELLAKNGTIGAPAVTRRRRRRRGDSEAVTVAELTGDLPVIRDDDDEPGYDAAEATATIDVADPAPPAKPAAPAARDAPKAPYWSEPEPRWPKSPPQPKRAAGPERSEYPRPLPGRAGAAANGTGQSGSGAEEMSFDPMDHYADVPVDVMDSEVREAEPAQEDSAYVRSFLRSGDSDDDEDGSGPLSAGVLHDEHLDIEDRHADADPDPHLERGRFDAVWRGGLVVLQSMLAVAFGGGLFVAFDQLWRWNSLVALVLSVLVILGLVAGVRVVRKTEDIASTLIAVAVGALITLGPLALSLQSG